MLQRLHIVSFQLPSPPDYGGVIDVYYRIRALKEAGVEVVLHSFCYGRRRLDDSLRQLVSECYLYPRRIGPIAQLSSKPYIVNSRQHKRLLEDLKKDDAPILFEGLHTCALLAHPDLAGRVKWVRMHNVEPDYYRQLAAACPAGFRRAYFRLEAWRLRRYEPVVEHAQRILSVTEADAAYFAAHYPSVPVAVMHSFYDDRLSDAPRGLGGFVLYHANFEVAENRKVADYLVREILPHSPLPLVIAGKAAASLPSYHCSDDKLCFVSNPGKEEMATLIREAHVHLLLTFQATGLKLKLLQALHAGAFVLVNPAMLSGTGLEQACVVADGTEDICRQLGLLAEKTWSAADLQQRQSNMALYNNTANLSVLLNLPLE
ncbi:MAG: glycosyltransferase family 1 protein [Paludibacteraceae bacterium]|nr:glycosyltransferase family 1 protein [Paludibacteraceae bacterium]